MTLEDKGRRARENDRKSKGLRGPRRRNERYLPKPGYLYLLIDEGGNRRLRDPG